MMVTSGKWLVLGVLASLVALPFLLVIWLGLNIVAVGLFMSGDPSSWWYAIYYGASALFIAVDLWIGHQVWKFGQHR
ncbi:MAG: hypothetical protein ACR2G7_12190 [Acidimicrobiales bacterium]